MSLLKMVPNKAWYILAGVIAVLVAVLTFYHHALLPYVIAYLVVSVIAYIISYIFVVVRRMNEISKLSPPWKPYFVYNWHREKALTFYPSTSDFAALIHGDPVYKDTIDTEVFLKVYRKNKKGMTPELWEEMSTQWFSGAFANIVKKAELTDDLFLKFATHKSPDVRNAVRYNPHAPEEAVIASALTPTV